MRRQGVDLLNSSGAGYMSSGLMNIESTDGFIVLSERTADRFANPEVGSFVMWFYRVKEGYKTAQAGRDIVNIAMCSPNEELIGACMLPPGTDQDIFDLPRAATHDGRIETRGYYDRRKQMALIEADVGVEAETRGRKGLFSRPKRVGKQPGLNLVVTDLGNHTTRNILNRHGFAREISQSEISSPHVDHRSISRMPLGHLGYYARGELSIRAKEIGSKTALKSDEPRPRDWLNGQ
jgi:hypothetical protein